MTREETIYELGEWLEQMIQHGVPSHSAKRKALATAIALLSAASEEYKRGFEDCKRAYEVELARSGEAVQGEWIDTGNWMGIECSRCKCHSRYVTPFCPQCGARMKGGDDE